MWKLSTCVMLEELPGLMSSPGELELERSLNDSDPKLEAVEVLDVFDVVVVTLLGWVGGSLLALVAPSSSVGETGTLPTN